MPPCIVTAAGASSRMEAGHKLLLPWPADQPGSQARTVVEAAVAAPLDAGCPVVLVLGNRADDIAALFSGDPRVLVVRNPGWERGMLGSIQRGLAVLRDAWPDADAWFSHHADMPLVTAATFRLLAAARVPGVPFPAARRAAPRDFPIAGALPVPPLLAGYRGNAGKPALVPSRLDSEILELPPDRPLKPFLLARGARIVETGDPGVLVDIDTQEDYARLR